MEKLNKFLLFVLFILTVFLLYLVFAIWTKLFFKPKTETIVIKLQEVPLLPPHPHDPAKDSIKDNGHHQLIFSDKFIVPYDLWIKSFDAQVINADGPIIHHLYLSRTDQHDSLCPNYTTQALFVTSEVNVGPQIFPRDYGIFLRKGTPLKVFSMLHNPSPPLGPGKTYKDVSVQVTIYTEKNSIFAKHTPIEYHRLHLSDRPCMSLERGEIFAVPPNTQDFTKSKSIKNGINTGAYNFNTGGVIVGMGGHMHPFEGGKSVDVLINNSPVYSFTSIETDHGNWKSWDTPVYPGYIKIQPHDTISIAANYSNPNSTPVRGAMGMTVFYFAKD